MLTLRLTRRQLFARAGVVSVVVPLAALAGRVGDALPLLRPRASGASNRRCAQCGASSHTMLAASCPAAALRHLRRA